MARLLLVDDDEQILETARDILEDVGYQVDSATTAAAARTCFKEAVPAVLLVDFHLKDGSGVELAREMKAQHSQIKVILMTGEAHVDLSTVGGAIDASLLKPVHPQALIELLKKLTT